MRGEIVVEIPFVIDGRDSLSKTTRTLRGIDAVFERADADSVAEQELFVEGACRVLEGVTTAVQHCCGKHTKLLHLQGHTRVGLLDQLLESLNSLWSRSIHQF